MGWVNELYCQPYLLLYDFLARGLANAPFSISSEISKFKSFVGF